MKRSPHNAEALYLSPCKFMHSWPELTGEVVEPGSSTVGAAAILRRLCRTPKAIWSCETPSPQLKDSKVKHPQSARQWTVPMQDESIDGPCERGRGTIQGSTKDVGATNHRPRPR
jgi:hypothetical protein